jgi:hypothetical protein
MLDTISVNVVVGSDGFSELRTDDQTGPVSGWSSGEKHDSSSSVWECRLFGQLLAHDTMRGATADLEKGSCYTKGNTCAPEWTLVLLNRPWVSLQVLQDVGQLEFTSLDRQ